ncbi:unnamed protein product, partial [Rotaria socialis]
SKLRCTLAMSFCFVLLLVVVIFGFVTGCIFELDDDIDDFGDDDDDDDDDDEDEDGNFFRLGCVFSVLTLVST